MRKSQFIFVLMLGTSFATMARADDDTSYDNCARAVGADNCVKIGDSDTYYALSGDAGNQTMTIYGTSGSTAATVPEIAFFDLYSGKSTVPEGVKSLKTSGNVDIGESAFYEATGLTSVDLTGVQTMGSNAFGRATGLTSVDLTGVQTIGDHAFQHATSLTSVDLTGVQTIGEGAFQGATGLTSVDLTGVQTIGDNAFQRATGLTGHLDLSGVQTIGESAFYGATGLTSVDLTGVQSIGIEAFAEATGLTSVDLTGVQTIGDMAFAEATGLTSVDLTGVQSIGMYAFMSATGLTSVDLTGVQTIEEGAFYEATGLTSVDLTGVQSIGDWAFQLATGLTSVVISDSLLDSNGDITGISSNAFEESGLSTIYCPKGKTCGNSFEGVGDLETISYIKNDDGTYSVGENMYANADMMTKGITCEGAQCTALRTALDAGGTCSTQDACNTLALQYATPQPTKPQRADIRIYTIEEANAVAGEKNRVSIKYR